MSDKLIVIAGNHREARDWIARESKLKGLSTSAFIIADSPIQIKGLRDMEYVLVEQFWNNPLTYSRDFEMQCLTHNLTERKTA